LYGHLSQEESSHFRLGTLNQIGLTPTPYYIVFNLLGWDLKQEHVEFLKWWEVYPGLLLEFFDFIMHCFSINEEEIRCPFILGYLPTLRTVGPTVIQVLGIIRLVVIIIVGCRGNFGLRFLFIHWFGMVKSYLLFDWWNRLRLLWIVWGLFGIDTGSRRGLFGFLWGLIITSVDFDVNFKSGSSFNFYWVTFLCRLTFLSNRIFFDTWLLRLTSIIFSFSGNFLYWVFLNNLYHFGWIKLAQYLF